MRRAIVFLIASAVALVACAGTEDIESMGPQRSEPSEPATGPVVAMIDVSGTSFQLHNEGDGCVAVSIVHPELQTTVERRCFEGQEIVSETSTCGWLASPDDSRQGNCDVALPEVLYGQVTDPNIAYLCIGTIEDSGGSSGVTAARFVEPTGDGFILEAAQPNEAAYAHLFNSGGFRYGDPPLDAPSDPIYKLCEGQAPWGEPGHEYGVDLEVTFAESLRTDNVTVFLHSGLDRIGLSGSAFDDGMTVIVPVRVPDSSASLGVDVETEVGPTLGWDYPWPDDLIALLQSGTACNGLTVVRVSVGAAAIEGSETSQNAIELEFAGSECPGTAGNDTSSP